MTKRIERPTRTWGSLPRTVRRLTVRLETAKKMAASDGFRKRTALAFY